MQDCAHEAHEVASKATNSRIRAASMMHEDKCFYCDETTSSQLIYCSFCPKAYHRECLPEGTVISFPRWGCPSHKCQVPDCGASSSKSRRKIYRCAHCPSSYCFAHLAEGTKILDYNPWQSIGYRTGSFVFIVCTKCTHKHQDNGHEHVADSMCAAGESPADGYKRRNKRKARELSDDEDEVQIRTAADPALVNEIKSRLKALGKMQREVARDIGVSEGILSQYMNGATRSNGWRSIETKLNEWLEGSAVMTPVNAAVESNNNVQSSESVSGPRLKRRKLAGSSDAAHDDHSGTSSPTREVGAVAPIRVTPLNQHSAAFNLSQLTVVMPTSQPMTINNNNNQWLNQAHMTEHMSPITSSEEQVSSSYELHELQFYNPSYNYEYLSPSSLDLYVELTDDNVKQIVAESSYYNNNSQHAPAHNEWTSPFAV
eukprot:TRINITY_DN9694_c0_g1_i1.p1 TRINITY_DN9694_c0_g1~~TRINITY_DN9694_c0_g1_i1.p1  ORF type:complete len:429 (-),score=114.77 TRINITY_DN9694_c0_g1_i1:43-1329(-)